MFIVKVTASQAIHEQKSLWVIKKKKKKKSMKKEAILYQLGVHVWQVPIGHATT